jgi:catechol 2,3-dioxygenase-like lactoylglutathione lyase family enzyme
MNINHLDLQVSDVQEAVSFFERVFGLVLRTSRTSPAFALLNDDVGFTLVIQRAENVTYPPDFHLGFLVDDVELVRRAHERAKEHGYEVSDVVVNGRGTMIYCRARGGFLVEVSCRRGAPPG